MGAKAMLYRLIIITGPRKGERITIHPEPLLIGRDPDCDVLLDDEEIARRHAQVEQTEAGLFIRDLGTMNRMIVNHHEVSQSRLKHGDVVELGHTRFLVQAVVQAEVNGEEENQPSAGGLRRRVAAKVITGAALLLAIAWFLQSRPSETPEDVVVAEPVSAEPAAVPPPATVEPPLLEPPVPWREIDAPTPAEMPSQAVEEIIKLRDDVQSLRESIAAIGMAPPASRPVSDQRKADFRITQVDTARFQASDRYDDMRMLTITLEYNPAVTLNLDTLRVRATFFEQDRASNQLIPSAATPEAETELHWGARNGLLTATITYLAPAGYLEEPKRQGKLLRYFGARIELREGNQVLASRTVPPALAKTLDMP
ncbi:MAG: FHA domain-containing protein [Kiritimatiellae bacterium]|nr:FHA domain-containing protein [Kiritimatiellia bacterium]